MTFGEIKIGDKFDFVKKNVHDGIPSHKPPFERVGMYRYRSSLGEYMVENLGIEVKEISSAKS